jgi:hypothetical protein
MLWCVRKLGEPMDQKALLHASRVDCRPHGDVCHHIWPE